MDARKAPQNLKNPWGHPGVFLFSEFLEQGMIDQVKADQAKENYLFLRRLECAIRIIREKPSNNLPRDTQDLAQLARLMSYKGDDADLLASTLKKDYEKHTKQMRKYYSDTIGNLLRTGPRSASGEENRNSLF